MSTETHIQDLSDFYLHMRHKPEPVIPTVVRANEYILSEWNKMLRGEIYDASNPLFGDVLMKTRKAVKCFNELEPDSPELETILRGLLGSAGSRLHVNQPFRCDYGCNTHVGENFFANFNLTILDEALVIIGDNCFIGPNVSIYTACHPLDPVERATGVEWAEPVVIGDDVWIGGGATITPGVTVGDGCVIGAGSVVTRDIPPRSVVAGVPARVIKTI